MKPDPSTLMDAFWRAREAGVDFFAADAATAIAAVPGLDGVLGRDDKEGVSALVALQAMALATNEASAALARTDLVVSLPARIRGLLRTSEIARTLVQSAREEVLVIGYELRDETLWRLLQSRGADGVAVTVVGNREGGGARRLLRDWPAGGRPLAALQNVEPAQGESWIMHGKVIVADRSTALIGSANFTVSGMNSNFEFGVRVQGRIGGEIALLVERLERQGWLERIRIA